MRTQSKYFFCSERILQHIPEVEEIYSCVKMIPWQDDFSIENEKGKIVHHQTAYNAALKQKFSERGWENQPMLISEPRLIGDFRKSDIFVEVQFGNSSTLYRDYYKFHYGLTHGLLSLAVLIVPVSPESFFPTRPKSVNNMASFELADRYFSLLPIPVPVLLIGMIGE